MNVNDPIADLMVRIRNANFAKHDIVQIPSSNIKVELAKLLKEQKFITDYNVLKDKKQGVLQVMLKYNSRREPALEGFKRLSRPGRRIYVGVSDMTTGRRKIGLRILSTPKGLVTASKAKELNVGGELLFEVW
jgi:small subunit ribosomal protein S8